MIKSLIVLLIYLLAYRRYYPRRPWSRFLAAFACFSVCLSVFSHDIPNKSRPPQTDSRDALPHAHSVAQCDKLATDYRRQFIALSVRQS